VGASQFGLFLPMLSMLEPLEANEAKMIADGALKRGS
jgi:hypothetical protein